MCHTHSSVGIFYYSRETHNMLKVNLFSLSPGDTSYRMSKIFTVFYYVPFYYKLCHFYSLFHGIWIHIWYLLGCALSEVFTMYSVSASDNKYNKTRIHICLLAIPPVAQFLRCAYQETRWACPKL